MVAKASGTLATLEVGVPLHRIERWFLYAFLILAACSWVGISVAELHLFSKLSLLGFSTPLVLAGTAIVLRSMRRTTDLNSPPLADQRTNFVGAMLALGFFFLSSLQNTYLTVLTHQFTLTQLG